MVLAGISMDHFPRSTIHPSQSSPNCLFEDDVVSEIGHFVFPPMDPESRTDSQTSVPDPDSERSAGKSAIPAHVFGRVGIKNRGRMIGGILKNSNYNRKQMAANSGLHFCAKSPFSKIKNLQSGNGCLSTSLYGLSSDHPKPRKDSCSSGTVPLERRYNKSCDWSPAGLTASHSQNDALSLKSFNNPIAQVSTDILRLHGYTSQFKNLLTTRSRRESGPGALLQRSSSHEEKCNGDVKFDVADLETGGGNSNGQKRASSTVKVIRRRQSGYGIAISSDSTAKMRCRQRKVLFQKRNRVCDLSLLLAIIGLILIVIDAELTALNIINKYSIMSMALRSMCVASTLALILTLISYHQVEVKIALIDSGADDWRVAVTTERIVKLAIEIAVCAICPFPGSGSMNWPYISPEERRITMVSVPVDVILSVPMFLRAYLLCRFMVLHSKQFQDAATRSIAALNRISMDFRFVIKTMMADHPLTVLIVFTVSFWICMSWMFTQCERYNGRFTADHYYLNSLWFVTVSFLSVGYGDIVPSTYCGRMLAITTGIVGAGVSSALIAVISRKLELSRAEKHVNNFMADSKLTNQRKNAAASVLQQTWFIHKYQRTSNKGDDLRLRHHQRKFLNAINDFQRIKWDQRKLQERGNSLLDVGKLHNEMHETLWEMHRTQDQFIAQIDMLTQRIMELQNAVLNHSTPNGPPTYSRQFSGGGSTLQVPGAHQGQLTGQEIASTDSNGEIVAIPVSNFNKQSSSKPSAADESFFESFARTMDDAKSPPIIGQDFNNEEKSPLIRHEV